MNKQKEQLTEFEELVQADMRNEATDAEHDELRDPVNAQDWHDELLAIIRRVDVQLSNYKAEMCKLRRDYDAEVARKKEWRGSALGFRALAEKRLAEVKQTLREKEQIEIFKVRDLEGAIKHHRSVVEGDVPQAAAETADKALWAKIE